MEDVGHEERSVDGDVLARADEFLPVHQRGQEGKRAQQCRLRPQPEDRAPLWSARDVADEEEAQGDRNQDAGEVEAPEPEQDASGGLEVKGKEVGDPAKQGECEQREVPVKPGAWVTDEDQQGEAGEEQDAEDVERGKKRRHEGMLCDLVFVSFWWSSGVYIRAL